MQNHSKEAGQLADRLSLNVSRHLPVDTFPELLLDHPSSGQSYLEDNISSGTRVLVNDSTGSWPFATTGLPAETVPGSTASLGDPGRINPFQNADYDQLKLPLGRTQPYDSNDMAETLFCGGAHVDTEARPPSFSTLPSLSVSKPDEADDKITVVDIHRLLGINHDRVCACLNCLDFSSLSFVKIVEFQDRFPALHYISCRVEGCTWRYDVSSHIDRYLWSVIRHEESHFREENLDQDGKVTFACKDDRCQIRTKRINDVKRHYATVHCKNPERFPCHVIGCRFGGENGFTRKDKLTSHMKSTHKGLPVPGKRLQAIRPKAGVSNAGVHKAGSQA